MRRENGWCEHFCILGLLLLHCFANGNCSETLSAAPSTVQPELTALEENTTEDNIYTTKLIEEITDNSIAISPTSGLHDEESSDEKGYEVPRIEISDNFTATTAAEEHATSTLDSENVTEPSVVVNTGRKKKKM